jgi:hypothetical protein
VAGSGEPFARAEGAPRVAFDLATGFNLVAVVGDVGQIKRLQPD